MHDETDDVAVNDTDELTTEGGRDADRTRHLSDYSRTNSPLSAAEIEERESIAGKKNPDAWSPRTTENIHDMVPESPAPSPEQQPRAPGAPYTKGK